MPHRFATLAVALAAATPVLAQDAGAEFTGATTIDAGTLQGVGDLEFSAHGQVEVRNGDTSIYADSLRFNREFGRLDGEGGVRLSSGADRFYGPRLQYNTQDDTGVFEQPTYLLQRERTARGGAERVTFLGRARYLMSKATFTTCQPGQEDWVLVADEIDLDYENLEGRARRPRLRFFDTTVLASPYLSFPLENRRKSGFLTPYYSQGSQRGFEVGIPYYWNIAPELDATFTPVYMAKRGEQLKTQGRYLQSSYAGEARVEYLPHDEELGRPRTGVSWQHVQTLRPNLTAVVDYNKVSDDTYFVDLASQVKQVSLRTLPQDAFLTYGASGLGLGAGSTVQARVQKWQTLQDPLAPIVPPYDRLPQINYSRGKTGVGPFDGALGAEFVRFKHESLIEGTRTSVNPSLALPTLGPGWFFTPKAGVRYMGYSLERTTEGQDTTPHATVPWLSVDTGLVFDRDATLFGDSVQQTLEPRLFYVYAPYRNQDQIPLFDTALADFNYPQLFNENRFSGGDRFGDANQLTAAVTSRLLQPNGQERLRATIGQRYYFQEERVGLTSTSVLRTSNASDILASLGGRLARQWIFDVTTQYNLREAEMERFSFSTRYSPEIAKVINASYRFQRDSASSTGVGLRQIDVSGQWPLTQGWYGVGRYNYSLRDRTLLEGLAGFEYNAGCWVFRSVVQRLQAATNVTSTAIIFQIEFNGLGQIGTDQAANFMRRNVPGYSVTNPSDPTLAPPSGRPSLPFEQVF
ncbi:MAG: LPS-assembly protein [Betaproteobacteria bacterium]|jgi:LPS-assembly protein|nr:LPS-assembly protein [Betaproteobacteria bacterium]